MRGCDEGNLKRLTETHEKPQPRTPFRKSPQKIYRHEK